MRAVRRRSHRIQGEELISERKQWSGVKAGLRRATEERPESLCSGGAVVWRHGGIGSQMPRR